MKTMADVFAIIGEVLEILSGRRSVKEDRRVKLGNLAWELQTQICMDNELPTQSGALRRLVDTTRLSTTAAVIFANLRRELDRREESAA